jgi:hypothetical protein
MEESEILWSGYQEALGGGCGNLRAMKEVTQLDKAFTKAVGEAYILDTRQDILLRCYLQGPPQPPAFK